MFLYYAPSLHLLDRRQLAGLGLAYLADAEQLTACGCQRGPDGGQGIVFTTGREPGECGYRPAEQTWRPIPGGNLWLGWRELPTPDELLRPKTIPGPVLRLADDREWQLPIARSLVERDEGLRYRNCLPQRLDLAGDGRWIAQGPLPQWAALWELAQGWYDIVTGSADAALNARFDDQGAVDAAVLCLQANYRLGRAEVAALGILSDELVNQILDVLIDRGTLRAYLQKKTAASMTAPPPAGSSSSAGPADSMPATGPPSPTAPPSVPASPTPIPSTSTSSSSIADLSSPSP